jgi:Sec-independent protein secretion pathway component TatC
MTPFAIGYLELATILVIAVVSLSMFLGRFSCRHWSAAILGCVTLAAILTPADLFSMSLMTVAFIGVYLVGTWHQTAFNNHHARNSAQSN